MTLDDIEADEMVVMTNTIHRLFMVAKCDPACHCCRNDINIGHTFCLAEYKDRDVMLCEKCTVKDLVQNTLKEERAVERDRKRRKRLGLPPRGYSRPTQGGNGG